ncbi:MAG: hypothetical protein AB1Z20_15060, partial [Desulfobacterales bacterium]
CKYGIHPYLQPLNQSTDQPINDIWNTTNLQFLIFDLQFPDNACPGWVSVFLESVITDPKRFDNAEPIIL